MARYDLTDFEWSVIEPLLPRKSRGVPRVDDRRVLNGIFWVLRSGAPWADLRMWRLRPFTFLPASNPRGPPLSVVFTDWLSMMPADGLGRGLINSPSH